MIEHVRSKRKILGRVMDLINPVTVIMSGANINRDTVENLRQAGLKVTVENNLMLDIVKFLQCGK